MDHVAGYAALVQEEASSGAWRSGQARRGVACVAVGLLAFLVLAGVAVMLG